jgi:hypothetical protein
MENDVVVTGRMGVKDVRHGCHGSLEVHGAVLTRTVGAFIIPLDVVEGSISYGRFVRTGGVDETGFDLSEAGHSLARVVESFANVGSSTATAVESERSHGRKFLLVGLRFRQL